MNKNNQKESGEGEFNPFNASIEDSILLEQNDLLNTSAITVFNLAKKYGVDIKKIIDKKNYFKISKIKWDH